MLKNQSYKIYQDTMYNKWARILQDLALNRFIWDFKGYNGDSRFFEKMLLSHGCGCLVNDFLYGFLFLGASVEDYNIYRQPTKITAMGYDYNKQYGSIFKDTNIKKDFAFCNENQSDLNLRCLIDDYANDLANIDTTLFFLIKKLKQPYVWQIKKDELLTARIIQNQLENGDILEVDDDFNIEDKLKVLDLNISNQAIQELEILKNQKYGEILQLIGITTIEYEKSERLNMTESNINNQKVNRFLSSSYNARKDFVKEVKDIFNIEIECNLNNDWIVMNNSIIDNNNYSPRQSDPLVDEDEEDY